MMPVAAGLWVLVIVPLRALVPNALLNPPTPRPGRKYTFRAIAAGRQQKHGKKSKLTVALRDSKMRSHDKERRSTLRVGGRPFLSFMLPSPVFFFLGEYLTMRNVDTSDDCGLRFFTRRSATSPNYSAKHGDRVNEGTLQQDPRAQ